MKQIRKMGPLTSLLKMMPGVGGQLVKQFGQMKKLMLQVSQWKMPDLRQLAGGR